MYDQVELEVVGCGTFFTVSRIRLTEKSFLALFKNNYFFQRSPLETLGYIDEFNAMLYNRFNNDSIHAGIVRVVDGDFTLKITNIPECNPSMNFLTIEIPQVNISLNEINFQKIISFLED